MRIDSAWKPFAVSGIPVIYECFACVLCVYLCENTYTVFG